MAQFGHSVWNALLGASTDTMCAPGARTSGLARPSCVVPTLDQSAREPWPLLPVSSMPPTEITYGSLAGAYCTASAAVPRLPAAATTTMPFSHAYSTAASSGSVLYDCGVSVLSDRLSTRMLNSALWSTTNAMPLITSRIVELPASSAALTAIRFASGAMPTYLP